MVGQVNKYVARIKKAIDVCEKSLKRELLSWRTISFNIVIRILVTLLSKAHSSRVSSSYARAPIPASSSFLRFLLVLIIENIRAFNFLLMQAEENQTAMKMNQTRSRWKLASLVLMSLSLVTIVSCLVSWFLGGSGHHERYLILLDAGSVHTSVYTYR